MSVERGAQTESLVFVSQKASRLDHCFPHTMMFHGGFKRDVIARLKDALLKQMQARPSLGRAKPPSPTSQAFLGQHVPSEASLPCAFRLLKNCVFFPLLVSNGHHTNSHLGVGLIAQQVFGS